MFCAVRNSAIGNGFDWHQIEDHTLSDLNGKCLIVNAATDLGEFYKTTIKGLCENTTFEFSAWLVNLVKAIYFCSMQPGGTRLINVSFEIWDATDTNLLAIGVTAAITETISFTLFGSYSIDIKDGTCNYGTRIFNISVAETPIIDSVISDGNDIVV